MTIKINYKGYTIKLEIDQDPQSPRDWDNLGTMVCEHPQYALGDKPGVNQSVEWFKEQNISDYFVLPLYLYDHSGITIRTTPFNDNFDSGHVGYIYCSIAKAKEEYPNLKDWKKLKAQVYKMLEGEVEVYNQYLMGECYGHIVTNKYGEEVDSCWGFYGREEAIEDAKYIVDYNIKHEPKARNKSILSRMTV
jgi:hypothetical protein